MGRKKRKHGRREEERGSKMTKKKKIGREVGRMK